MAKINRESEIDAGRIIEKFLPNQNQRSKFLHFLSNAIEFTNNINSNNWNLNLDSYGNFLRFNTGQEFCIELNKYGLLILCNRLTIKNIIEQHNIPVIYRGYKKGIGDIINMNFEDTPDLLSKTKNSIGCILNLEHIENYIDFFEQSNREFILDALHTTLTPLMRRAHSIGAVEYVISKAKETSINDVLPDFTDFANREEIKLEKAKVISQKKRLEILKNSNKKPQKTIVRQVVFQRNPYVVAEALFRANGICERCKKPAPFQRDNDATPYLEVHHIITLADGGDDTLDNVIALCPNCHRHAHFGKKTY